MRKTKQLKGQMSIEDFLSCETLSFECYTKETQKQIDKIVCLKIKKIDGERNYERNPNN